MARDREQHNQLQVEYFDRNADYFLLDIPEDVQARTAYIVETAGVGGTSRILDVGTGAGVLIHYFLTNGAQPKNIVGCDLCAKMLEMARSRYPEISLLQCDVMEMKEQGFDHIFFNACFGNMLDQKSVLAHCRTLLNRDGKIVISHPAAQYVENLHVSDPEIVPHLLPSKEECDAWASELALNVVHYESTANLYLAILQRPAQ